MGIGTYLAIAARNLLQARRRSILLGLALAMVTFLLVLLLALSQGLSDTIIESATTLSSGHVNLAGFYKTTSRQGYPMITDTERLREIVRESTPELDYFIDRHRGWGKVVSERASLQAVFSGVDVTEEQHLVSRIRLANQSEYQEGGEEAIKGDARRLAEANTAMIFAAQAKRLEVGVGDVLTVVIETLSGKTNTGDVEVVAVAKDVGFLSNWSVFVPKQTVRDLYRLNPDTSGAVHIYLKDPDKSEAAMLHLRGVLAEKGFEIMEHRPVPYWQKFGTVSGEDWVGQKLDLSTWSDEVSFLTWVVTAIDIISFILVVVLILIIAVGIINTMWIAVRERTGEVGTLRAIGMGKRRVLLLFMAEALLLGLVSTGVGGLLGGLTGIGLNAAAINLPSDALQAIMMSETLHLTVLPGQIILAVVIFTVLTGIAALWPAYRASRLQPITAIQHVH